LSRGSEKQQTEKEIGTLAKQKFTYGTYKQGTGGVLKEKVLWRKPLDRRTRSGKKKNTRTL